MKYFFDSSGIFAWADASSPHGKAIDSLMRTRGGGLVTTNLVVAETLSLVTKRVGKAAGVKLGEALFSSRLLHVVYVDENLQRAAWDSYKKHKDKDFDLIDAVSFTLCRKLGINDAITLDRHFAQMGFEMLPERA